jgi:chromosome segregation ATPase
MSVALYESLFREYILIEELSWSNTHHHHMKHVHPSSASHSTEHSDDLTDLMNSYQQKLSLLHEEISTLKQDIDERDKEVEQLRVQCKILKQRSRSADRNTNSSDDANNNQRSRRGISVDGGGNLREQLEASIDENRLLKNKLLRLEDELNGSVVVRSKQYRIVS